MSNVKLLGSTILFQSLGEAELLRIADLARVKILSPEATVFSEGDTLNELFLLEEGSVRLTTGIRLWSGDANLLSIISVIGAHDTFGWSALQPPHQATLSATTDSQSKLVAINATGLRDEMERDPRLGYSVMNALAGLISDRLRRIQGAWMSAKASDLQTVHLGNMSYR